MANNIPGLKTAVIQAFTANLDAATRTKLAARFVSAYQSQWDAFIAGGGNDTAGTRGAFAADLLFDYLYDIYRAGSQRENQAALPEPEVIQ